MENRFSAVLASLALVLVSCSHAPTEEASDAGGELPSICEDYFARYRACLTNAGQPSSVVDGRVAASRTALQGRLAADAGAVAHQCTESLSRIRTGCP